MNSILKNVAAVASTEQDILGHLTWYSMGEMLIAPDDLRGKMVESGLDEIWMPKDIRIPDAFRRATAVKHRRQVNEGIYENYICREVASDKTMIQRNIVCETVDSRGKKLKYEQEAAIIMLDKKNLQVTIKADSDVADQIARESVIRFDIYRNHYSGAALRTICMNILKSMSPTPVRPAGGVYFIPSQFEDRLHSMVTFMRSLEKGESEMIPLINTQDMKGMVTRKLNDHLQSVLKSVKEAEYGNLPKGQVKEILEEARRVSKDYKEYEAVISGDLHGMELKIDAIKNKVAAMLQNMAS